MDNGLGQLLDAVGQLYIGVIGEKELKEAWLVWAKRNGVQTPRRFRLLGDILGGAAGDIYPISLDDPDRIHFFNREHRYCSLPKNKEGVWFAWEDEE